MLHCGGDGLWSQEEGLKEIYCETSGLQLHASPVDVVPVQVVELDDEELDEVLGAQYRGLTTLNG